MWQRYVTLSGTSHLRLLPVMHIFICIFSSATKRKRESSDSETEERVTQTSHNGKKKKLNTGRVVLS